MSTERRKRKEANRNKTGKRWSNLKMTDEDTLEVISLLEGGEHSAAAIGRIVGCSQSTVSRIKREYGLASPTPEQLKPSIKARKGKPAASVTSTKGVTVERIGGKAVLIDETILRVERKNGDREYTLLSDEEVTLIRLLV